MDITLPLWTLLVPVVVVLVLLLAVSRARGRVGRHNRRRQRVASAGERHAETLLKRAGYRVTGRQVTRHWTLWVDDTPLRVSARADLLVKGPGGRFVAEVKTGAQASRPTRPATRRQLFEYLHVFPVDGVLLVDMHNERIRTVTFDWRQPD